MKMAEALRMPGFVTWRLWALIRREMHRSRIRRYWR